MPRGRVVLLEPSGARGGEFFHRGVVNLYVRGEVVEIELGGVGVR